MGAEREAWPAGGAGRRADSGAARAGRAIAETARRTSWHSLGVRAAAAGVGGDRTRGLGAAEAALRRDRYGPNVLATVKSVPWYVVLVRQFAGVLILILVVAAAISLAVGEAADAATILAIVVLNGALGFVQEWRAEKALEALRGMLSPHCTVVRDGVEQDVDSRDLVPGDLVRLEIGDRVPADLRLVEALNLKVDESALTGESLSVAKGIRAVAAAAPLAGRSSMAWMGTAVTNGWARGLVVATGMATEFGRIAELTQTVGGEPTPLQRKLAVLGRQLGAFAIGVSALVAGVGWVLGKPLLDMFLTGVSLAVAVVPEGLPAVVTITLALGIRAMARRRALLRRLQAAESLGAASVICTDKTGTLTENQMTVTRVWLPAGAVQVTGVGYEPAGGFEEDGRPLDPRRRADLMALLETGLICGHARVERTEEGWNAIGEPTEAALVVAAYKAQLAPDDGRRTVSEFSFNSVRKRMTVVVHGPEDPEHPESDVAYVKGAPEVILERCTKLREGARDRPLGKAEREAATRATTRMAESGLRTLALARRTLPETVAMDEDAVEQDLTLLGVVGIIDPPRPEVPEAIRVARQAGIRVIMITGDAAATALAIARRIGLDMKRAVTSSDLEGADDDTLAGLLDADVLFARTTPEHKMRIVDLLQRRGHVVAMTGDGVNDAPALKKADIGISMGLRGTDVARGAADMVLTDDNFASIIGAVDEGRRQYDNIQKFVRYLLSSNTGEVAAIFVNILLGGPLILLPVQILWMNLVTDGVAALALGAEPADRDTMSRPPRPARERLLDWSGIAMVLLLGGYIGGATLWLFHDALAGAPGQVAVAQTVAFTGIIVLEKANVFNFRALRAPLASVGILSNPWLLVAVAATLGLQACAVYVPFMQDALQTVPLGWSDWGLIALIAAPVLVVGELYKWLRRRAA